jgi:hypothetical protein
VQRQIAAAEVEQPGGVRQRVAHVDRRGPAAVVAAVDLSREYL